jgi:hypothetical protein
MLYRTGRSVFGVRIHAGRGTSGSACSLNYRDNVAVQERAPAAATDYEHAGKLPISRSIRVLPQPGRC